MQWLPEVNQKASSLLQSFYYPIQVIPQASNSGKGSEKKKFTFR